jgi:two-component system LytT family response regulator
MKIRTLIVSQETAACAELAALLASEPDVEVMAQTHPAALEPARWSAWPPDLVFLDVGSETEDVSARLTELHRAGVPAVVVLARTARYALAAFDAAALDYLLKPVQPGRLRRSLQRVREHLLARELNGSRTPGLRPVPELAPGPLYWSRIPVRDRERVVFVPVDTLRWAEAAENYVILHTTQGNHIIRQTLSALEAALDPEQFCRLNRSTLVNLEHLAELRPLFRGRFVAVLRDGTRLTVTRPLPVLEQMLKFS